MKLYIVENMEPVEAQRGDVPTHGLVRLEDLSGALHAAFDAGRREGLYEASGSGQGRPAGQHAVVERLGHELGVEL